MRPRTARRDLTALLLVIVSLLALAAVAPAIASATTTRYVSVGGDTLDAACPASTPCEIRHAIQTVAVNGDEVVIAQGTYDLGTTPINASDKVALNIHGASGQPRPLIKAATPHVPFGYELNPGREARVAHISFEQSGADGATTLSADTPTIIEDIEATSSALAGSGMELRNSLNTGRQHSTNNSFTPLLRNSLIRETDSGSNYGVALAISGGSFDVRNVTAISKASTAVDIHPCYGGSSEVDNIKLDLANLIGRGNNASDPPPISDFKLSSCGTNHGFVDATISNSNLRGLPGSGEQNNSPSFHIRWANNTPGGSDPRDADPRFVDPAAANYHLGAGSPSIDMGLTDSLIGSTDLDGRPRTIGSAPDMGAYEATAKPVTATTPAANVTPSGATLKATVNPGGLATSYHFVYHKSGGISVSTADQQLPAGTADVSVSQTVTGLDAYKNYAYHVVASNVDGSSPPESAEQVFKTPEPAAIATTGEARAVTQTGAILGGSINPNGNATAWYFRYGTTSAYGSQTSPHDGGSGTSDAAVSDAIAGLAPGVTYHYQVVATHSDAPATETAGADATFTTSSPPPPPAQPPPGPGEQTPTLPLTITPPLIPRPVTGPARSKSRSCPKAKKGKKRKAPKSCAKKQSKPKKHGKAKKRGRHH